MTDTIQYGVLATGVAPGDTTGTATVRTVRSTYDAFGRVLVVTDSAFATPTTYKYDADGRVTKIDSAQGTLHYGYDNLGRKTATWTGSGETLADARTSATTLTEYGYDSLNRLIKTTATRRFGQNVDVNPNVAGVQPEVTSTVFAVDGQIDYETATTAGGIVTTAYAYDPQGHPSAVDHFADNNNDHAYDPGDTLLFGASYAYNKDGTRKGETDTDAQGNVTTEAWTYDGDGRVATETFDGFDGQGRALDYTDTFLYDVSGNRMTLTHADRTPGGPGSAGADSVVTDKYDGDDRLVSEAKDVGGTADTADDIYTAYGYTGTDQTTQTVHQGLTAGGTVTRTTTYTYDVTGRMAGASITDSAASTTTSVNYAYNASGVRVERTEGGVRTVYLVDADNPTGYTQVLEEGVDANNNHKLDAAEVQTAYTLGMQVLAQATATQVLHLLTDAHGSTRAVLDAGASTLSAAAVLQGYAYSAFGSDLGLPSTPLTAVRYAGQMIDPLTGLSYNRARWYDPATGRFTQLDTYGGNPQNPATLNKYLYGNGNPVNQLDPSGRWSLTELLVTISGGESLEKLQNAYKTAKTEIAAAKMLVRIALVSMEVAITTIPAFSLWERVIGSAYYFYQWFQFEENVKKTANQAKLGIRVADIAGYLAILPRGIEELRESGYSGGQLGNLGRLVLPAEATVHNTVFIPLTGNRDWDKKLAWAVKDGLDLSPLLNVFWGSDTNLVAAGTALSNLVKDVVAQVVGGQTWHHNEVMGVMQLVDSKYNNPDEGVVSSHVGAFAFWRIINFVKEYKGD